MELARDCAVPPRESAFGLVSEAVSLLGSPDTAWRDDVGYGVVAACVYQKKLLKPEERREIVTRLSANLRKGIGEANTDSVLLRTFSALDLSIFAALEDREPALDEAGYRKLLDDALAYLRDERDLRGLDPRVGWIHATAHTSDLLKFLARDARFVPADHARLFDAAWTKMATSGTPVFTHAEDERLAAALVSVVRRPDFDPALLDSWLARFVAREVRLGEGDTRPGPARRLAERAQPPAKLLRAPVAARAPPGQATAGQAAAREKALATLAAVRRSAWRAAGLPSAWRSAASSGWPFSASFR